MGTPIAQLLKRKGHQLTVWNRTATAAELLAGEGALVAPSAVEAVAGVPVVLTILSNDAATQSVVFGTENVGGILDAMERNAVHVSLSTISVKLSRLLAALSPTSHGGRTLSNWAVISRSPQWCRQ